MSRNLSGGGPARASESRSETDSAQTGTRLTLTNPVTEPIKQELEPKTKEEPVDTHLVTELESELTEPATKQQAEARIKIEKFNQ